MEPVEVVVLGLVLMPALLLVPRLVLGLVPAPMTALSLVLVTLVPRLLPGMMLGAGLMLMLGSVRNPLRRLVSDPVQGLAMMLVALRMAFEILVERARLAGLV